MNWGKRLAIIAGVVVALLLVAAGVLIATFDANRFKSVAIDWMKANRDRTLAIDGPIELSFFPRLSIELSKLRLSERGSADEFAAIDSARLSVDPLPLLRKRVVVDRVEAKGVRARITRDANGVRNIDDLMPQERAPAAREPSAVPPSDDALRFDVSAVRLADVRIAIDDAVAEIAGEAALKSLATGRLANKAETPVSIEAALAFSKPVLRGALSGSAMLELDLDASRVRLGSMKLAWTGDAFDARSVDVKVEGALGWDGRAFAANDIAVVAGATLGALKLAGTSLNAKTFLYDPRHRLLELEALRATLAGNRGERSFRLGLDWPRLEARVNALTGSALSGSVALGGDVKLDGSFKSGPPSGSFDLIKLPGLTLDLSGSAGARSVKASIVSNAALSPSRKSAAFDDLELKTRLADPALAPLDIEARGSAAAEAASARWTLAGVINQNRFDIDGSASFDSAVPRVKAKARFDELDLNRLLPRAAGAAGASAKTPPGPADSPIDLGALNALDGELAFSAGALAFRQYRIADARIDAALDSGVLRVPKLSGKAWGGAIDASAQANAKSNRVALKLAASGVDVNALLKDVAGKDLLEGTGRVNANLASAGKTVGELRARADGNASVQIRNGAIKGFNIARALREARAALTLQQDAIQKAQQTEKTDFSELSASVRIADGVARNDDLDVKSPFLRIGGSGVFDIGRGRIDYVARATVTATSKGQGGAELAALRGVTVPVLLTGPFDSIDWKIQWTAVAAQAAQSRLKDKLLDRLGERLGARPADGGASAPRPQDILKERVLKELFR